jgi:hypothetical protein
MERRFHGGAGGLGVEAQVTLAQATVAQERGANTDVIFFGDGAFSTECCVWQG